MKLNVVYRLIDSQRRIETNIWTARGRIVARQLRESRSSMPSNVIPFRPSGGAA